MKEVNLNKILLCFVLSLSVWIGLSLNDFKTIICHTAFSGTLLATLWITEAVHIYLTSLIPLVLFPVLGIMSIKDVAPNYTQQIIFLFIGGFLIAYAIEKWNLHKRIALWTIIKIGRTPRKLLLAFMLTSYVLSMWIVNTATTLMLLPAALAVLKEIKDQNPSSKDYSIPILLGIAYAASIGGTATLIGTAPNTFFMEFFNETFPNETPITFGNWFVIAFPISLAMISSSYLFLRWKYFKEADINLDLSTCKESYDSLGRMSKQEKIVSFVFLLTIFLWFFRRSIQTPFGAIPGWSESFIFSHPEYIKDSTVAMFSALLLFLIPSGKTKGEGLITWEEVKKIPIGILFLFGAGFALAESFTVSGLSVLIADQLQLLGGLTPLILVLLLCSFMTFFTEITSNTASTMLILPILGALVLANQLPPRLILIPVTVSASFAFMLPVATPPNTIVFGTERIPMKAMIHTGFWLNLLGIGIATLCTLLLIP